MIAAIRNITLAAGALGAAGVTTFVATNSDDETPEVTLALTYEDDFTLCLKTDIEFFENVSAGCYARSEVWGFRDAAVINQQSEAMSVEMTHPTDLTRAPQPCRTCREYAEMQFDGWYAMSSRDIRREAFFIRACGTIDLLLEASPAATSFFDEAGSSADDMVALGATAVLRVGEDVAAAPADDEASVARVDEQNWQIESGGQIAVLQEIASADFDNDGVAEILVFLASATDDGATARVASIALLEKDSQDAVVSMTPLTFGDSRRGASGAP